MSEQTSPSRLPWIAIPCSAVQARLILATLLARQNMALTLTM